jgi:hypothetical protein
MEEYAVGDDGFRRMAAHESAHALVNAGLGISVVRLLVVQHTHMERLLHAQIKPSDRDEANSHTQPDPAQYRDAPAVTKCLAARAGEVGERLHLGRKDALPRECWRDDYASICEHSKAVFTTLPDKTSRPTLDQFIDALAEAVESWLKRPDVIPILQSLKDTVIAKRTEIGPNRFKTDLENADLKPLLASVPQFPVQSLWESL